MVDLFKRTFGGPSLNWLSERECATKSIPVLKSLMHPISLATFEKPGPSIQQKRRARRRSSILQEHPPSPGMTCWPMCLC